MAKVKDPVPPMRFAAEPEEDEAPTEDQEIEVLVRGRDEIPPEPTEDDSLPEEFKGMSKAQLYAQLQEAKRGSDQASALQSAISDLGERLSKPTPTAPAAPAPIQQPGESDAEFAERINKSLFGDNPYAVLQEAIRRELAPHVRGIQSEILQTKRRILEKEETSLFTKYREEIEATVATLPPEQRLNPGAYEWALGQVKVRHLDDIIEERVQERVKSQAASEEAKETTPTERRPQVGQGVSSRGGSAPRAKRRVVISAAEAKRIEDSGMSVSDWVRVNGG